MLSSHTVYYISLGLQAITAVLLLLVALSSANKSSRLTTLWLSEVHLLGTVKARWSLYRMCDLSIVYHTNINCTSGQAAYPYSPWDNLPRSISLPTSFETRRSYFSAISRSAFWFLLVGLIVAVIALALHAIRCRRRLVQVGALVTPFAWIFVLLGASLATAAHRQGVSIFRDAGYTANLGGYMFSLLWTAVVLELFALLMAFYNQYLNTLAPSTEYSQSYVIEREKQQLVLLLLLMPSLHRLVKHPLYPENTYWYR